jgi:Cft2 family RNA processing exonuclease
MKKIISCLAQNQGEGWCSGTMIIGSYMFHRVQRIITQGTTEMQSESN